MGENDTDVRGGVMRALLRAVVAKAASRPQAAVAAMTVIVLLSLASKAPAQLRVVDYNIAQLRGTTAALQYVLAALHEDDKPGFAVPVSIFVFQEVRSTDVAELTAAVNAAAPPGITYTLGTYTSSMSEDSAAGAQAIFYRDDMLIEQTNAHIDLATGGGRNTDRWLLRLSGYNSPLAWMYIYASHLKSDTGSANETERLNGVATIRTNADALGSNLHVIFCGDMNFYHNNEPGYQRFFVTGNAQAIDPLGTGSWAGSASPPNNANNFKHTQSPLLTSVSGLVGGGMDDRFDFQLSTGAFHDGAGLSMLAATYRALGNDGLHFDQALDSGNNFYYPGNVPRSNALAMNLRLASDHVPVVVDYQIPARMAATIIPNYGRVIVGTPFEVDVSVTNPAPVDFDFGADLLQFTATGSLNLSGTFSDSVAALSPPAIISFPLNTSAAGVRNGTVTLTTASQGAQPGSLVLNTTGMVVRPANPSFSSTADVNQFTIPLSLNANTGTHQINVDVHNFGFDALQAALDIDIVSGVTQPFAFLSGLDTGIGSTPATLAFAFNTSGAAPGQYLANVTIHCSDEDIPGEDSSELQLTLNVTVEAKTQPCAADITGDNLVNVNDLLAVINAWGLCPDLPQSCAADVAPPGGDGLVNVNDLLAVINAWGACP